VQTLFPSAASDVALDEMLDGYAYPAIAGARWWLRAVMVSSVDGAVTGADGRSGSISSTSDRVLFRHLRTLPDAVIVGAGTARAEDYGQPATARLVVVSRSLSLDPQSRLFDGPGRVIVATSRSADWNAVERLAQVADVVRVGDADVDLTELVGLLADQGLARLQCEGGPALLGDIVAAGLLDELCLTTVPTLVGGSGARIVAGAAPDPSVGLALASMTRADDGTVFSRWRRA
jgi:riboflavin-specific deaminase-like protein